MSSRKGTVSTLRVVLLGAGLLGLGTMGFYSIPGLISKDAAGSHLVNAFYCSAVTLTTVGFGDICPGEITLLGKVFLVLLSFGGIGMFCGPISDVTGSWHRHVPGGYATLASVTVGLGVAIFTMIEGFSEEEAIYASVIAGTTIGFGDRTPSSDIGKIAIACYVILVVNVIGALLQPARAYLEGLCRVEEGLQAAEQPDSKKSD